MGNSLKQFHFRKPGDKEGPEFFSLAKSCAELDVNSLYFYLLFCRKFSETSVAVYAEDKLAGFLIAFPLPDQRETLFVWQIAISIEFRGMGLGKEMLNHLIARDLPDPVKLLEVSITPSNLPSQKMFRRWANEKKWECREEVFFSKELFNGENHESETLFRIGPLSSPKKGNT